MVILILKLIVISNTVEVYGVNFEVSDFRKRDMTCIDVRASSDVA